MCGGYANDTRAQNSFCARSPNFVSLKNGGSSPIELVFVSEVVYLMTARPVRAREEWRAASAR